MDDTSWGRHDGSQDTLAGAVLTRSDDVAAGGFARAGDVLQGDFRCVECGYGVTIYRALPVCPMCGGSAWRPGRSRALAASGVV